MGAFVWDDAAFVKNIPYPQNEGNPIMRRRRVNTSNEGDASAFSMALTCCKEIPTSSATSRRALLFVVRHCATALASFSASAFTKALLSWVLVVAMPVYAIPVL